MAKQILGPNTTITVNGTDLSQWFTNVSINDAADEVEVTGFSESYREHLPGLKDATITATVLQDYASSATDQVLATLYYNNTAGTVKVNPNTGGTVVYTLVGKLYGYNPVNGAVGAANDTEITFRNASTAGLTRGTA